jgi:hypothetical protein
MLAIDTIDFQLLIKPVSVQVEKPGGPYLEWINVQVIVTEPGIRAEGRWRVMPGELLQFQQQIQAMYPHLQPDQSAKLAGIEREFELTLRMLDRGAIIGDWRFQPVSPDGACITGSCGLDQSFLPEILRGIESLLSFVEAKNDTL